MKKRLLFIALYCASVMANATNYEYKFRLTLTDKGESNYTIDEPERFLSKKAIQRRNKQNIKINETDLPISDTYIQKIEALGGIIVAKSKWNNTIAVHCKDSMMVDQLKALPFVKQTEFVWRGAPKQPANSMHTMEMYPIQEDSIENYYGMAYDNIKILKGDSLHNRGFRGQGITIAVIDAGFTNLPKIQMMSNINLKGFKSFVYEEESLFHQSNEHGINVLSCIATNMPNRFVGTAPEADIWILGTEDSESEYPIEEDYWATAIEYADSIGVDVVNTSLGYTKFDAPAKEITKSMLDGETMLISRAAGMAAKKGMLIVVSAGNSGNKPWGRISPPADAFNVLTVGAVQRDSTIASFSSLGLTADLRVKPDVVALGSYSVVINDKGKVNLKSGTSFSSPIMCGIAACLWQAFPSLTNLELLDVIRESGDRVNEPDVKYGFGIPDMEKAIKLAQVQVDLKRQTEAKRKK